MKNKLKLICILFALILVFANISSVGSKIIDNDNKIPIEISFINNRSFIKKTNKVDIEEAKFIKNCLIELDNAYRNNDKDEIIKYESILIEKEILNENIKLDLLNNELQVNSNNKYLSHLSRDENTSNSLCFINAVGEGMMIFTIGAMLMLPTLILVSIFGGDILKILLPIYVGIFFLTHIIPARIMLPIGIVTIDSGSISMMGTSGSQKINVNTSSSTIYLAGFSGITINIPSGETGGFLFVSGFSFHARVYQS
jgi:hypothetical protein